MKKSFLVLITVVFVAAVVAVGLYGLKYKSYYDVIYPTSIKCDKYRIGDGELIDFNVPPEGMSLGCNYYTTIRPGDATKIVIELVPTVYPTNATETDCTLVLVENCPGVTVDSEKKTVTIDCTARAGQPFSFRVTVTSNHDTSLQQSVLFRVKP